MGSGPALPALPYLHFQQQTGWHPVLATREKLTMFMTAAHSILPAWGRASVSARLVSRGAAFNPMRTLGERLAEVVLVHWQGAETHTPVRLHKRNLSNWGEALLTQDSLWPHTLLQAVLRATQPGPVWESIFREAGLTRSKHHDKRTFWHSNLLRLLKVLPPVAMMNISLFHTEIQWLGIPI